MEWTWRGRVPYAVALREQRAWRERRIAGETADGMWLLEHEPVITTGRRHVAGLDPRALVVAGYELHSVERGGLATCHEPGQLVGYIVADVRDLGPRRFVAAIEGGLLRWLEGEGVVGARRPGFPGVWVAEAKVAAIGIHVSRGVSMHGFAINLVNDLTGFSLIVPCGIPDAAVTSVARLRGRAPSPEAAAPGVAGCVVAALLDARGGRQ